MKTNEWTYEEMSLQAQVNQKKPKKVGENTGNKKKKTFTNKANDSRDDVIIVGNMATKRQTVGNFMGNPTQNQNKKKRVRSKSKKKI